MIPASTAVHEAEQAGAPEAAPYDYWLAQAYLEKAAEEANEAEYQDAIRLADSARDHAERALRITTRGAQESERSSSSETDSPEPAPTPRQPSGASESGASESGASESGASGSVETGSARETQPLGESGEMNGRATTSFRSESSAPSSSASSAARSSARSSSGTSSSEGERNSSLQPLGPDSEVP